MPLTDIQVKTAKPKDKPYKLADGGGMFLLVTPSGGKLWRLKYRVDGKENLSALGSYPLVSLKEAREKRDAIKKQLSQGANPSMEKKREAIAKKTNSENTFQAIALEFLDKRVQDGLSTATIDKAKWFLSLVEADFGKRPVAEIEPYEVLEALKKIEKKGHHETAKRLRAFVSRVFRYAIITSRAKINPASELGMALIAPKVRHHSAILDPKAVGELLRKIDTYTGYPLTKLALQLSPHIFVRPGELRKMEWAEIDFEAKVWRIPAAKMKMRSEHVVPLSAQSLSILLEATQHSTHSKYVFHSYKSNSIPMSENTVNQALRRLGYTNDDMTAHGFRSTASTLLNESGKWSSDAIERALAHRDTNAVRSAYHRGTHWNERVEMAQWWSDYLDELRG